MSKDKLFKAIYQNTQFLSPEELGIFVKLVGVYLIKKGNLRNDPESLKTACGITKHKWLKTKQTLLDGLIQDDGKNIFIPFVDDLLNSRNFSLCSQSAVKKLYEEQPFCIYCKSRIYLTVEHIQPRSKGGGNEDSNLALACEKCNKSRKDKNIFEWRPQLKKDPLFERYLEVQS